MVGEKKKKSEYAGCNPNSTTSQSVILGKLLKLSVS